MSKKNKREIEISVKRRIRTDIHAAIPRNLYEILFRAACDLALNGDRDAAQWFVDELIILERQVRVREYNSKRINTDIQSRFIGQPCVSCGKPADTIDHIVPLSKGGGNEDDNLQPMCWDCNRAKGDR